MSIGDWTSNRWATVFAEDAERMIGKFEKKCDFLERIREFTLDFIELIGKTSDEIGQMLETDQDGLNLYLQSQHFKQYVFKLRSKVETWGDSQRNKISVQSAAPINYKEYNDYLIKNISRLTGIGKH